MQEDEIVRLDVSVDDALGMALCYKSQDTSNDVGHLLLCKRCVSDPVKDTATHTKFHDNMDIARVLIDILHHKVPWVHRLTSIRPIAAWTHASSLADMM